MRRRLEIVYEQIEIRARTVAANDPAWPCTRGCDACCRSLAEVPRLTRAEWDLLAEGIAALDRAARAEVEIAVETMRARDATGDLRAPVTCPLLDPRDGACRVYRHRPATCRTYGFYVDREAGLWCGEIEARWTARGDANVVVFGNQHAVDRQLESISGEPARSLLAWWDTAVPRSE